MRCLTSAKVQLAYFLINSSFCCFIEFVFIALNYITQSVQLIDIEMSMRKIVKTVRFFEDKNQAVQHIRILSSSNVQFASQERNENQREVVGIGRNKKTCSKDDHMKKGIKLLVLKLRRIALKKLRKHFLCLQRGTSSFLFLSLLGSRRKRQLREAFQLILKNLTLKSTIRVQTEIESTSNPSFIFSCLARIHSKILNNGLRRIKMISQRIQMKYKFCEKLTKILLKDKNVLKLEKQCFKKLRQIISAEHRKIQASQKMDRIFRKIKSIVQCSVYKKMISFIQLNEIERQKGNKKNLNSQMVLVSTKKVKAILQEKQQLMLTKRESDEQSTDKNRYKTQLNRILNIAKNKAKEQMRANIRVIRQAEVENEKLKIHRDLLQETEAKMKSTLVLVQNNQVEQVRSLYERLKDEECEFNDSLVLRNQLLYVGENLENYPPYHLYKNQKMRQLLWKFERKSQNKERQKSASEMLVIAENQSLKEVLRLVLQRNLEKFELLRSLPA